MIVSMWELPPSDARNHQRAAVRTMNAVSCDLSCMLFRNIIAAGFMICYGRPAFSQEISFFDGRLNCDTARRTLELSLCSAHHHDSLATVLEGFVAQQVHELDSIIRLGGWHSLASDENEMRRARAEGVQADSTKASLLRNQMAFREYLHTMESLVFEMNKDGTARSLLANEIGIRLLQERLAILREQFQE